MTIAFNKERRNSYKPMRCPTPLTTTTTSTRIIQLNQTQYPSKQDYYLVVVDDDDFILHVLPTIFLIAS